MTASWQVSAVVVVGLLAACKGKTDAPAPEPAGGSGAAKTETRAHAGIAVTHSVAEFSGTYDKVFAQVTNGTDPTTIAFVRGCPALTCETAGAFEAEQIAHTCPKAYVATVKITADKPGRFRVPMKFSGPGDNVSTATLDEVGISLSANGNDGIAGTASQKTTESSVDGSFTAEICGRS